MGGTRFRLTVVGGVGAALLLSSAARGQVAFRTASGCGAVLGQALAAGTGEEEKRHRQDDYYAGLMKEWMRGHGREPSDEDLRNNESLRKWWNAYKQVRGREDRERADERKRHEAWKKQTIQENAKRDLQQANDLYVQRRWRDAIGKYQAILRTSDYSAYFSEAQTKLQDIDRVGQDEVNQAKSLASQQKYEDALQRYLAVVLKFGGVPSADAARKEYQALKASPAVQAKLKRDRAADLLKRAEAALAQKDYVIAVGLYEMLAKEYADLDEGKAAEAQLETLKADKEVWPLVLKQRADAEAKSLLAMARSYLTMGQAANAVSRLKELVEKYPDSDCAKEAKDLLATLPEPATP